MCEKVNFIQVEAHLIESLNYETRVDLPYRPLKRHLTRLRLANSDFQRSCWCILIDVYFTDIPVTVSAEDIAIAVICISFIAHQKSHEAEQNVFQRWLEHVSNSKTPSMVENVHSKLSELYLGWKDKLDRVPSMLSSDENKPST